MILALLALAVLLMSAVAVIGVFGFVIANIAVIAVALLGGLAIAALFGGMTGSATAVATIALLMLLLSGKRRRVAASRRNFDVDIVAEKPAKKPPAARAAPPATQTPLDLAWDAAAEHADWARSRLAVARESCRLFVQVADRMPLDIDAGALAVRIRKRIPEHVAECLDKVELATASERRAILEELVFTLEKVGATADRQRTRLMGPVTGEMDVQRKHLTHEADNGPIALD
jgi:hypothetical protein